MKKMLTISLVTAMALSTSVFAEDMKKANSINEMFSNGSVSGDLVVYGEQQNNSGTTDDAGFTMNSVGLAYETAEFNGFKSSLGFRANNKFSELEDADYDESAPSSIMHTANISYTHEYASLAIGRQEIDLEWMGDFHEAVVGAITAIPDTTIVLGHSRRKAVADADAVLEAYADFNGVKGASVIDAKYEGVEGLALNAYYYNVEDVASWYGAKADYDYTDNLFGGTLQYAASNEDVAATEDGSILAVEVRGSHSGFSANLGYIATDKDGAIGSMSAVGDNINPLEDGNQVYVAEANTIYLGLGYELDALALGAIYGSTDYSSASNTETELNVTADYAINDELTLGALYVNVGAQDK